MVMVLGASGDTAEVAPGQSVDNCVHDVHQGFVERFPRRGRIDTLPEILPVVFLKPTVLFYGFDGWIPECVPVDRDTEDRFHEVLEIDENAGTKIFTNVVIIISAGGYGILFKLDERRRPTRRSGSHEEGMSHRRRACACG